METKSLCPECMAVMTADIVYESSGVEKLKETVI